MLPLAAMATPSQEPSPVTQQQLPAANPRNEDNKWNLSQEIAAIASFVAFLELLALLATISIMRNTEKRQLRAYISVIEIESGPIVDDSAAVTITIKNCGQTPADHVVGRECIKFMDASNPVFDIGEQVGVNFVVGPGVEMTSCLTVTLGEHLDKTLNPKPRLHDLLLQKSVALYVFGEIRYRDVFYKNRWCFRQEERVTTYRAMISGKEAITGGKMSVCREGNNVT